MIKLSTPSNFRLGKEIFDKGEIEIIEFTGDKIIANIGDSQRRKVEFLSSSNRLQWNCTCKRNQDTFCKHWKNQQFIDELSNSIHQSGTSYEYFEYPCTGHLFTDPDLPDYDRKSTELLWQRVICVYNCFSNSTIIPEKKYYFTILSCRTLSDCDMSVHGSFSLSLF
jgi:hypothetical protein